MKTRGWKYRFESKHFVFSFFFFLSQSSSFSFPLRSGVVKDRISTMIDTKPTDQLLLRFVDARKGKLDQYLRSCWPFSTLFAFMYSQYPVTFDTSWLLYKLDCYSFHRRPVRRIVSLINQRFYKISWNKWKWMEIRF